MRSALGKGLGALISDVTAAKAAAEPGKSALITTVPLSSVKPNPAQPRKTFSDQSLQELAASIQQRGVLQPILVTLVPSSESRVSSSSSDTGRETRDAGPQYEIIAGERRWRAAQTAGLTEIPVIVKTGSEAERFEMALIENVQREDLNPIDQATGFQRLMGEFHLTQEDIAKVIGKDRTVVANTVRLLNLPDEMREAVRQETITAGHARALVAIDDPVVRDALFKRITTEQLSVRAVEQAARDHKQIAVRGHVRHAGNVKAPEVKMLEEDLQRLLSRKVEFHLPHAHAQKGWIRLEFYSLDDLDHLVARLKKTGSDASQA